MNQPFKYLREDLEIRSKFLLQLITKNCAKNIKILELGCSVGRNLNILYHNGYKNLAGIEINKQSIELMEERYSEMYKTIDIYTSTIENAIKHILDLEYDLIFSMAVLEHVHTDSEFIFREIARITKTFLITIEDESSKTWRHFPRDYNEVFSKVGFHQIESICCKKESTGFNTNFVARVFQKNSTKNFTH